MKFTTQTHPIAVNAVKISGMATPDQAKLSADVPHQRNIEINGRITEIIANH